MMKKHDEDRNNLFDVVHRIAHGETYRQITPVIETTKELADRLTDLENDEDVQEIRYEVDELNNRMDEVDAEIERGLDAVKDEIVSEMVENANDMNDELMNRVVDLEAQLAKVIEWARDLGTVVAFDE